MPLKVCANSKHQAVCGFTCSDEITLVFPAFDPPSKSSDSEKEAEGAEIADTEGTTSKRVHERAKPPNGGRVIKSVTLYAGFASTSFYKNLMVVLNREPEKNGNLIRFAHKVILYFSPLS